MTKRTKNADEQEMSQELNRKAIDAVFGNRFKFRELLDEVLIKWQENTDEDSTFAVSMGQFCYEFDSMASEVAADALGVDVGHWGCTHNHQMESGDVQHFIDQVEFKDRDQCVNLLLKALHEGDMDEAQARFKKIVFRQKADFKRMSEADTREYLVYVNREMGKYQGIDDAIAKLGL